MVNCIINHPTVETDVYTLEQQARLVFLSSESIANNGNVTPRAGVEPVFISFSGEYPNHMKNSFPKTC